MFDLYILTYLLLTVVEVKVKNRQLGFNWDSIGIFLFFVLTRFRLWQLALNVHWKNMAKS